MSVVIKNAKVKDEEGKVINFNAEDYMAVKGSDKSFFPGQVKVVHKVQGEKLVKSKMAEQVKATLIKEDNLNRSTKDIKQED